MSIAGIPPACWWQVESYAANLTAGLTVSALQSSVNSIADLRGKAVGTEPVRQPALVAGAQGAGG